MLWALKLLYIERRYFHLYHPRIVHLCNVKEVAPSKRLNSKVLIYIFYLFLSWFHNNSIALQEILPQYHVKIIHLHHHEVQPCQSLICTVISCAKPATLALEFIAMTSTFDGKIFSPTSFASCFVMKLCVALMSTSAWTVSTWTTKSMKPRLWIHYFSIILDCIHSWSL